jgi:hypothetical protein
MAQQLRWQRQAQQPRSLSPVAQGVRVGSLSDSVLRPQLDQLRQQIRQALQQQQPPEPLPASMTPQQRERPASPPQLSNSATCTDPGSPLSQYQPVARVEVPRHASLPSPRPTSSAMAPPATFSGADMPVPAPSPLEPNGEGYGHTRPAVDPYAPMGGEAYRRPRPGPNVNRTPRTLGGAPREQANSVSPPATSLPAANAYAPGAVESHNESYQGRRPRYRVNRNPSTLGGAPREQAQPANRPSASEHPDRSQEEVSDEDDEAAVRLAPARKRKSDSSDCFGLDNYEKRPRQDPLP